MLDDESVLKVKNKKIYKSRMEKSGCFWYRETSISIKKKEACHKNVLKKPLLEVSRVCLLGGWVSVDPFSSNSLR